MTAKVLRVHFHHDYNQIAVAQQEYEAAKEHFHEVSKCRIAGDVDHDQRFRDACDRREAARDRYVALLTDRE